MFACISRGWSDHGLRTSFHPDIEAAFKHGCEYFGVFAIERLGDGMVFYFLERDRP